MRRADKEIKEFAAVLDRAEILHLGLIDNGYAYIIPLNFIYHNGAIFFHSAKEGRKIEILKSNGNVSFEADIYEGVVSKGTACGCTSKYLSVMGLGSASFLTDRREKKEALSLFMSKYSKTEYPEIKDSNIDNIEIIKIDIKEASAKQSPAR